MEWPQQHGCTLWNSWFKVNRKVIQSHQVQEDSQI